MRTDGIQATSFEPEPDNAPSGSSTDGYNITHGRVSICPVRMVRPPNVAQLSLENRGYLAHYHERVAEAMESWEHEHEHACEPDHTSVARCITRSCQLLRGKLFLQFIAQCLVEYLVMDREEGTLDMLARVEELLDHAEARLEPLRLARAV